MPTEETARKIVKLLQTSQPQTEFRADVDPTEGSGLLKVSAKGSSAAHTMKKIVLTRLDCHPETDSVKNYRGDTYAVKVADRQIRFNFAVTATQDKPWWTNTTVERLRRLQANESVLLGVWNYSAPGSWNQRLISFAIPPTLLLQRIQAHEQTLVEAFVRATCEKAERQQDKAPGLAPLMREVLGTESLTKLKMPQRDVLSVRDDLAESIRRYRARPRPELTDSEWKTARHVAQKVHEKLETILLTVRHADGNSDILVLAHDATRSELLRLEPTSGLTGIIDLGEDEIGAMTLAESDRGGATNTQAPAPTALEEDDISPDDGEPESSTTMDVEDLVPKCVTQLQYIVGIPLTDVLSQIWAALESGKHVVLTGAPGTAKTTIAEAVARCAVEADRCSTYVFTTASTDWTALDTIGGYVPDPAGTGTLKFQPGKFLECFRDEDEQSPDDRWLVIDELNRADVDKAFGQFFTILSGHPCELPFLKDGRCIAVVPESASPAAWEDRNVLVYRVPDRWRIIATLNTEDKASLYEMSFAFLRRFAFVHVPLPDERGVDRLCQHILKITGLGEQPVARLRALWGRLRQTRPLGPAILLDMARYLDHRHAIATQQGWTEALSEAIAMYVVPQLEGLGAQQLEAFVNAVRTLDVEIWNDRLSEMASAFLPAMQDVVADIPRPEMQLDAEDIDEREL